jgi:hypothetical protein
MTGMNRVNTWKSLTLAQRREADSEIKLFSFLQDASVSFSNLTLTTSVKCMTSECLARHHVLVDFKLSRVCVCNFTGIPEKANRR